jgi:hypothetical protein
LAIVSDTEKSPLLRNIDVAFGELRDTGNYRSSDEEALAAKNHLEVILVVPMSKLRLLGTEREFRYLPIRTSDGFIRVSHDGEPERYEAPTNEEQEVKDIFGYTLENLTMLKNSPQKIKETRIWTLNPGYVQEEAGKVPGRSSLWRASRLYDFGNYSSANAVSRSVGNRGALRGVRASVSEPVGVVGADASGKALLNPTFEEILDYSLPFILGEEQKRTYKTGLRERFRK